MRSTYFEGQAEYRPYVFVPRGTRPILPTVKSHEEFKERLGRAVKRRRIEKGWTQSVLADEAGLNQADISRIERGEQGFDSSTIYKIAKALESSLTDIFAEVEQTTAPQLSPEAIEIARLCMMLPSSMREEYRKRLELLGRAMGVKLPDEEDGAGRIKRAHARVHR